MVFLHYKWTFYFDLQRVRKIRRKQVCRRKTRLRNFRLRKFRLIGKRQCTPKGQARYENVRGSVQWKEVYRVGVDTGGAKFDCGEISLGENT